MSKWLSAIVLLSWLAVPLPAPAQKLYKCGKQYQDRPCDAGTATPPPAPAAPAEPVAAPASTRSAEAAEKSRVIRCENWNRQIDDVRRKEKGEKNQHAVKALAAQRENLEGRAKGDGC